MIFVGQLWPCFTLYSFQDLGWWSSFYLEHLIVVLAGKEAEYSYPGSRASAWKG